jgi:hypothetical protein
MIRNLKTLGLVVVAVLVMSAMVASAASAANEFHSTGAPTTITGSQVSTNVFHIPGAGTWECTTATFHGTQTGTTITEWTIHPVWSGCKLFGFSTTDMSTTGCDYTITQPSSLKSVTHIACSGTNLIKATPTVFGGSVCTLTLGSQSPSGVVDFKNEAGGKIFVTWTITGISHSAGCGASAASDGTYTGTFLVSGDKGAISVS